MPDSYQLPDHRHLPLTLNPNPNHLHVHRRARAAGTERALTGSVAVKLLQTLAISAAQPSEDLLSEVETFGILTNFNNKLFCEPSKKLQRQ